MASHACQHAACVCRDVRSARVGPSVTVVSTAGAWLRPPSVRCSTYRFYTPSIPLRTRSARQRPSTRELPSAFVRTFARTFRKLPSLSHTTTPGQLGELRLPCSGTEANWLQVQAGTAMFLSGGEL